MAAVDGNKNNTLSVTDVSTGVKFLVDSGAEVSVFPISKTLLKHKNKIDSPRLVAANGSPINTYGKTNITLNLGRNSFTHSFYLAEVSKPILGADFFVINGLLIDLKNKRLISSDGKQFVLSDSGTVLNLAGLSFTPYNEFKDLLDEFPEILIPKFDSTTNKHGVEHHIVTTGPPVHSRPRRLDAEKYAAAKEEFLQMEQMGIIRRSKSQWAAPLHMVHKADGKWRACGDYRGLNMNSEDDRYPLPHIHDCNANLANCTIFSKIDLIRGYNQIPMAPDSITKTAIITPFGLWEFLKMPFGLKNAAQAFQRLMDSVLQDVPFAFVYLDDILIASIDKAQHRDHLRTIFQLLSANDLVVNKAKCVFGVPELDFLGHHITDEGILPLRSRVKALLEIPVPQDRTSLQRFLGMINYYHRFLPNIAENLSPLHAQSHGKGQQIEWTPDCQNSFELAKKMLSNVTLLHHPRPDARISLTVDASDTGLGGKLEQFSGKSWLPIAFFSQKLSTTEKKYSTFDRELLAAFKGIKHFSHFLEGRVFVIFTDHRPLVSALRSKSDHSPRQSRHLSYIAEFTSHIEHISGKSNVVADTLSRTHTPPIEIFEVSVVESSDKYIPSEIAALQEFIDVFTVNNQTKIPGFGDIEELASALVRTRYII